MSFIAITYGYNMYSIFNIHSTTLPLIDNIVKICMSSLRQNLYVKKEMLQGELNMLNAEEDNIKKQIYTLESDKAKEEMRQEELKKMNEQIDLKKTDRSGRKPIPKTTVKGKGQKDESNMINILTEEVEKLNKNMTNITHSKEIYEKKIKQLKEQINIYENTDDSKLVIDLLDPSGNRVEFETRDNTYADTYLLDKQCYELLVQKISKYISF